MYLVIRDLESKEGHLLKEVCMCVEEAKATTAVATRRGHQSQEHRASSHDGSLMETGLVYTALVSV